MTQRREEIKWRKSNGSGRSGLFVVVLNHNKQSTSLSTSKSPAPLISLSKKRRWFAERTTTIAYLSNSGVFNAPSILHESDIAEFVDRTHVEVAEQAGC